MTVEKAETRTMTIKPAPVRPLRHEQKHRISLGEDAVLTRKLRRLFSHDRYAGPEGSYQVTSLYFDTPYDEVLREKINGLSRREKFRLRYYERELGFIRLEKKFKVNGLCGKRSTRLLTEQVRQILQGEYNFLLHSGDPLLIEFYSQLKGKLLRPRTIVRYDREAFVYGPGNVRITLDRGVRTGLGSIEFLNPDVFCHGIERPETILEVKYDEFLPELVRMAVQVPGCQASACSKYVLCRRYD